MKFVVTIFSCELSPRIVGKIISRVSSTDVKRKTEIVRTWAIPSKWERPRISLIFCFQISPPITATGAVNSPDVVAEIFRAKCGFDTCEKIRPKMKRKKERKNCTGNLGNETGRLQIFGRVYSDSSRPGERRTKLFLIHEGKICGAFSPWNVSLQRVVGFFFLPCALQIRWQMNHSRVFSRNWTSFITENSARRKLLILGFCLKQ